jgi:hypothetical protein
MNLTSIEPLPVAYLLDPLLCPERASNGGSQRVTGTFLERVHYAPCVVLAIDDGGSAGVTLVMCSAS